MFFWWKCVINLTRHFPAQWRMVKLTVDCRTGPVVVVVQKVNQMLGGLLGTYSETSPQVELLGPDLLTACATTKLCFCLYQDLLQRWSIRAPFAAKFIAYVLWECFEKHILGKELYFKWSQKCDLLRFAAGDLLQTAPDLTSKKAVSYFAPDAAVTVLIDAWQEKLWEQVCTTSVLQLLTGLSVYSRDPHVPGLQ